MGIFIDRNLSKTDRVLIPILDINDAFLMKYAQKLISNSGAQVTLLEINEQIRNSEIKELIRMIAQNSPNHFNLLKESEIEKDMINKHDLVIISLESWKRLIEKQTPWLVNIPSALIISEGHISN